MSRGYGKRQRQILDYLQEHLAADIRIIIAEIEQCDRWEIPDTTLKSYQRAWRKLVASNVIVFVRRDVLDDRRFPDAHCCRRS